MKIGSKLMFVVLSVTILTALTATAGAFLVTAAFADKKHCEDNGDDNCNHVEKNIKNTAKDECDNHNKIKDHSEHNDITNILVCSIDAAVLKDTALDNSSVFSDTVQPQFQ
ncbi:MAG TPA: hypothetical protein VF884_04590 [Nitrososphaeraceae archaeon]